MRNALLLSVLIGSMTPVARGQEWLKLEGVDFTQRQSITVENPSTAACEAALIHMPLAEVSKSLPDAKPGQVAVVDPTAKPAPREQADRAFVPFQVNEGNLIFTLPLKAHQKKQLYLYTSPNPVNLPG